MKKGIMVFCGIIAACVISIAAWVWWVDSQNGKAVEDSMARARAAKAAKKKNESDLSSELIDHDTTKDINHDEA